MRYVLLWSLLSASAWAQEVTAPTPSQLTENTPSIDFNATQPTAATAPSPNTQLAAAQPITPQPMELTPTMSEATPAQPTDPNLAYLASNQKEPGVTTLADGLQYRVIKEGTGKQPNANDTVTVNYKGMLVDKTVFDSSFDRHEPLTLRLDQVIQGWREALPMMKEGAVWELVIPSHLAYGDAGIPNVIPPKSVLIFEVQLISVNR